MSSLYCSEWVQGRNDSEYWGACWGCPGQTAAVDDYAVDLQTDTERAVECFWTCDSEHYQRQWTVVAAVWGQRVSPAGSYFCADVYVQGLDDRLSDDILQCSDHTHCFCSVAAKVRRKDCYLLSSENDYLGSTMSWIIPALLPRLNNPRGKSLTDFIKKRGGIHLMVFPHSFIDNPKKIYNNI